MPTPYGSRGGVALSADELRVVRDALAIAIESSWGLPRPARGDGTEPASAPAVRRGAVVRDCTELAAALDEAAAEADRMRLFRNADLARYRAALPGSAAGYAELLHDALAAGEVPRQADVAALRALCAEPADSGVAERRRLLLRRCEALTAAQVPPRRRPPASTTSPAPSAPSAPSAPPVPPLPQALLPRPALRALPGGRQAWRAQGSEESEPAPGRQPRKPGEQPQQRPPRENPPDRQPASPNRPVPTPAEVFPPRRRPAPPPEHLLRPHAARTA